MSFKQRVVFWLLFASISVACQGRLLRMSNQLTSAAVANGLIGWDYLVASSVSSAQYILPSFCELCEEVYLTVQIPNQPEFSATPTVLPFVSTMSVQAIEYDEANQLLLMTTVQPQLETYIFCYSFNLLSNQAEDFSELRTTAPGDIIPYYTLVDAVCVPDPASISVSTISSTLAHPAVSGATSYAITAVIPSPYTSLTLVAIANQSDPENPPNNIQISTTFVLGSPATEFDSVVTITSNAFSYDNQAPFVAVVYVAEDNTVRTHLQQIDTTVSPPAFGLVLDLDPFGEFAFIHDLQVAIQPMDQIGSSGTDWVVFVLLSNYDSPFNNSLYNFTVTSCVTNDCPQSCPSIPCFVVNEGQDLTSNFMASWNSREQPILSANKFSILGKVDASIIYNDPTDVMKFIFWETDENGNFPVGPGDVPTSFQEVFLGHHLYDVANNNVGGFVVAYGGDGLIHLAIRCNSTTDFVYDVIYYDDIYGSYGFAKVALSNSCNNGYVGAFVAAPVKDGGAIALYSAP